MPFLLLHTRGTNYLDFLCLELLAAGNANKRQRVLLLNLSFLRATGVNKPNSNKKRVARDQIEKKLEPLTAPGRTVYPLLANATATTIFRHTGWRFAARHSGSDSSNHGSCHNRKQIRLKISVGTGSTPSLGLSTEERSPQRSESR